MVQHKEDFMTTVFYKSEFVLAIKLTRTEGENFKQRKQEKHGTDSLLSLLNEQQLRANQSFH